jgi:hypothetical protein
MVKSESNKGNCKLVFDFHNGTKSLFWWGFEIKNYVEDKKWTKVEFGTELPEAVNPATDSLRIYFWDDKGGNTFIDDLKVEFITTDPTYELRP